MIEVNLLPEEYRRAERTPLPRFIVILVGVALVASLGLFLTKKYLDVKEARNDKAAKEKALQGYQDDIAQYNELVAKINEIKVRTTAIEAIWQSRLYWAVKLDQLADLVPNYVGLTGLKLEEPRGIVRGRGEAGGGNLFMSCISASENERRLANFRRVLKGEIQPFSPDVPKDMGETFFLDFTGEIEDYGYKVTEAEDYEEKEYIEFNLELTLKARGHEQPGARPAVMTTRPGAAAPVR
jgi:Tfp pilus assembly protein PilN